MCEKNFRELPIWKRSRLMLFNLYCLQTKHDTQLMYQIRNHTESFMVNIIRGFESCNIASFNKFTNKSIKELKTLYQLYNKAEIVGYFPKMMVVKFKQEVSYLEIQIRKYL